jgi:hypothetical protein
LVDRLLQASKANAVAADERLMDSGDLEKERGITITSKVTRIIHDMVINVADTPGHSDFSGEVDRFLSLSDGFILGKLKRKPSVVATIVAFPFVNATFLYVCFAHCSFLSVNRKWSTQRKVPNLRPNMY